MSQQQVRINPVAVALAVSVGAFELARDATRRAATAVEPVAHVVLGPPWLPERLRPGHWLAAISSDGEALGETAHHEISRRLDVVVPMVLSEVLRRAHLTDLILTYVDLDHVVSAVDLDAAATRLDVAAVVERVDIDPIVGRVDLDAVIDRLDLDALIEKVDLDAAIERVDLDAVLDRLDLTALVLERVDLDRLIAAVLERIDLIALADEVIEGVDLPEIIRESTGSMASHTVRGARMQGIVADEALGRAVDRLLLRRRQRSTHAPTAPGEPTTREPAAHDQRDDTA